MCIGPKVIIVQFNFITIMTKCPRELSSIGRDNIILYAGASVRSLDTPLIHLMGEFSSH
jgi:hypothetical protein